MALLLLVVLAVLGRSVGHFFDTAALMVAVTVGAGVAAVVAVLAFAAFMSVRRRRAAAGGCVGCQFQCQHAMTEQPGRPLLAISIVNRDPDGPRWPDRPTVSARTAALVPRPREAGHDERRRERAGSALLA